QRLEEGRKHQLPGGDLLGRRFRHDECAPHVAAGSGGLGAFGMLSSGLARDPSKSVSSVSEVGGPSGALVCRFTYVPGGGSRPAAKSSMIFSRLSIVRSS